MTIFSNLRFLTSSFLFVAGRIFIYWFIGHFFIGQMCMFTVNKKRKIYIKLVNSFKCLYSLRENKSVNEISAHLIKFNLLMSHVYRQNQDTIHE